MTKHPEDSSIKIRWQISGITGYHLAFNMMRYRVWQTKQMIEEHQGVYVSRIQMKWF